MKQTANISQALQSSFNLKSIAYNLQQIIIIKDTEFDSRNRIHRFYTVSASFNVSYDKLLLANMQIRMSLLSRRIQYLFAKLAIKYFKYLFAELTV